LKQTKCQKAGEDKEKNEFKNSYLSFLGKDPRSHGLCQLSFKDRCIEHIPRFSQNTPSDAVFFIILLFNRNK
jgi:hypothetical protein